MSRLRSATRIHPVPTSRTRDGSRTAGALRHRAKRLPQPSARGASRWRARAVRPALRRSLPVLLFCLTTLAGYLILAALMIGLGFLLVDVLLPVHAIGHDDEAVNTWLASIAARRGTTSPSSAP